MLSRRNFLKSSGLGLAGIMAATPSTFVSAAKKEKKTTANDKVNVAFIGLGQQCMHLLNGFITLEDVRVVAGCDVYDVKRDRFVRRVTNYYTEKGEKKVKVDVCEDYQDILARTDVDAVVIATPDHQHAIIAIEACKAGKDVYLEKPLTLTIYEGQMLCKAVRKYSRILQVGSMQRSSQEFIHAANICREGLLGNIQRIQVFVGRNANPDSGAPIPCPLPKQDVPAGLNWDKWLGPMTDSVWYHSDLDPIISEEQEQEQLWGAWRWYKPTGGGLMTDWGAHMFDIAQWMLGKDNSEPVEIIPPGFEYTKQLTYKYDNGVIMTEEDFDGNQGVRVYGDEGCITVHRGSFHSTNKKFDMKAMAKTDVPYETQAGHYAIFVNSIRSRIDPNVPVETGHSSCTTCNLGNIAIELGRPIKWNPIVQKFMNDEEATKLMHYQYRDGYKLEI